MKQLHLSLLLAATMIGVAFLAITDVIPEEAAQFAPFALLALFPGAWLRRDCSCKILKSGKV